VAVAAGVVAVALSGDDGDDMGTEPPEGVTLADLEPALLTEADVPSGFTLDESAGDDGSGDDPLENESIEASDECEEAIAAFEATDRERDEVSVSFTNDTDGSIEQDLSLADPDLPTLAQARAAIERCDTLRYSEEGATGEFRFETSDVDGIGDAAVGVTIAVDIEAEGIPFSFDMYGVLWERDGVQSSVNGFGGFDPSTLEVVPMDASQIEDLARTADRRIADVLGG
jgi:hypothetical protein